jgi:hypothetical protein
MSQDADTFATGRSANPVGDPGHRRDGADDAVDYRYLRLASVPFYIVAVVLLVLVFVPQLNIVVGGSARWLKLGPLPAIHPPRSPSSRWSSIWRTGSPSAAAGPRLLGGTVPFLIIAAPIIALVFKEPDLGHDRGHHADRVHDVLRRRREPRPPRCDGRRASWR